MSAFEQNINIESSFATDIGGSSENQDQYLTAQYVLSNGNTAYLFSIFDGHGPDGKVIASNTRTLTASFFGENIERILTDYSYLFIELFELLNYDCKDLTGGTTASIIIFLDGIIYSANVGDSSGKLFCKNLEGEISIENITKDHDPSDKDEFLWFKENKPNVRFCYDRTPRGCYLIDVFDKFGEKKSREEELRLPNIYIKNIKGTIASVIRKTTDLNMRTLAMTRSIGDGDLPRKDPTILTYDIKDKIDNGYTLSLLLASDGVWDNWLDEDLSKILFPKISAEDVIKLNDEKGIANFGKTRDNATAIVVYLER
jgi:serine/threonine protein phosphatase PrpC